MTTFTLVFHDEEIPTSPNHHMVKCISPKGTRIAYGKTKKDALEHVTRDKQWADDIFMEYLFGSNGEKALLEEGKKRGYTFTKVILGIGEV